MRYLAVALGVILGSALWTSTAWAVDFLFRPYGTPQNDSTLPTDYFFNQFRQQAERENRAAGPLFGVGPQGFGEPARYRGPVDPLGGGFSLLPNTPPPAALFNPLVPPPILLWDFEQPRLAPVPRFDYQPAVPLFPWEQNGFRLQ